MRLLLWIYEQTKSMMVFDKTSMEMYKCDYDLHQYLQRDDQHATYMNHPFWVHELIYQVFIDS